MKIIFISNVLSQINRKTMHSVHCCLSSFIYFSILLLIDNFFVYFVFPFDHSCGWFLLFRWFRKCENIRTYYRYWDYMRIISCKYFCWLMFCVLNDDKSMTYEKVYCSNRTHSNWRGKETRKTSNEDVIATTTKKTFGNWYCYVLSEFFVVFHKSKWLQMKSRLFFELKKTNEFTFTHMDKNCF